MKPLHEPDQIKYERDFLIWLLLDFSNDHPGNLAKAAAAEILRLQAVEAQWMTESLERLTAPETIEKLKERLT